PLKLAGRTQAGLPIANFANFAKLLKEFVFEERVGNSLVVREAVGVVAAITPWNYPLHQIALKVAPALAAGCTVVLKPSEVAPFNAFILAEAIEAAGLPQGVFNLVTGYGADAGEAPEGVPPGGYYVTPTVFGRVRNDMTIAREEIFGPVLSIIPYQDEEDAVRIANDTVYGLARAVWSRDDARAQRVARRIRAGQVDVNGGA